MRATTVRGETKGQVVRRGLLRMLRAGWTSWGELLEIGRSEGGWTDDMVEWMQVALREAIAVGEVERSPSGTYGRPGDGVRLTDQGLKAQTIAALEAVEAPDAHP